MSTYRGFLLFIAVMLYKISANHEFVNTEPWPCFPSGSAVKNSPTNTRYVRGVGLILGSRRSPGVGNGNPLQYSCLENSLDRGT